MSERSSLGAARNRRAEGPLQSEQTPYFCFTFNRWQHKKCGHKGCARRVVNKEAAAGRLIERRV